MFLGVLIGIFIYMVGIPITGQIVELICTSIECLKMKLTEKIAKSQKNIEELSINENSVSYPIGFQMPTEEEENYDEDE